LPGSFNSWLDLCKANGQKAGLAPPMYQAIGHLDVSENPEIRGDVSTVK